MKILVTGGSGYIGSHACVELLEQGYEVVIVDNLSNSKLESVKRIEKITSKSLEFIQADLQDYKTLRKIFSKFKFDAVLHFAGFKSVPESIENPVRYYINNLDSSFSLCKVMSEFKVRRLVFSSSSTVYGIPSSVPVNEGAELNPCNPYGQTKLVIENFLRDLSKADAGWKIILLRYFNPIGAHPSGLIGEEPIGIPNNLLPYISQVAIKRLNVLSIFGNDYSTPDGTCIRDYIHVVDLAKGHILALDHILSDKKEEGNKIVALNLGTGRGYSVLEVLQAFEDACGFSLPHRFKDRRPGDISEIFSDPSLALDVIGWRAELGIEQMCSDAWSWQHANPEGYAD